MTPDDAADLDHLELGKPNLGKLLLLKIPFVGSSVPADPEQCRRYALRLETRHYQDSERMRLARHKLDIASDALLDALSERRPSRMKLALALGEVQSANEGLA